MPANLRQMPPARLPVTHHHLFPAAFALWFAALLGLSSLAVRTALFEQGVLATGIERILPFAAPPLGHLARLLWALGIAAIGAGVGLVVAKLVARMNGAAARVPPVPPGGDIFKVRARDAHPDAPARRPVSARDELADAPPIPLPKVQASAGPRLAWCEAEAEPEPVATPPFPAAPPKPVTAAERIARAHPAELSPVELMERLAIAMQRREARRDGACPTPANHSPEGHAASADDERIATIESLRDTLAQLRSNG